MPPTLRSSRAASRPASNSTSRPQTPPDASGASSTALTTESARPAKQRRTGRNAQTTTVTVTPEENERSNNRRKAPGPRSRKSTVTQEGTPVTGADGQEAPDNQIASVLTRPKQWVEPVYANQSTWQLDGDSKPRFPTVTSSRTLETRPTARQLARAAAAPRSTGSRAPLKINRTKNLWLKPPGQRPPIPSDVLRKKTPTSAAQEIKSTTPATNSTTSGKDKTVAPVNGHASDTSPLPGESAQEHPYSVEQVNEIIDSAIQRALEDKAPEAPEPKVVKALRTYKENSSTDPRMLAAVGKAVKKNATEADKASFQALLREIVKAQQKEEAMKKDQGKRALSIASTSSLSSVPPTAEETPIAFETTKRHKRKLDEILPDLSDEAIEARRAAMDKAVISAREDGPRSNIRAEEGGAARQRSISPPVRYWSPASYLTELEPEDPAKRDPNKRYLPRVEVTHKTRANADEIDNLDFCRACNGRGELLCCDGCVDSYHFTCLDPPMDPKSPPEGDWYCPVCTKKGPWSALVNILENTPTKAFELPPDVRDFFKDTAVGERGAYQHLADERKVRKHRPRNKNLFILQSTCLREIKVKEKEKGKQKGKQKAKQKDDEEEIEYGRLLTCVGCGRTSEERQQMVFCDYCPSVWHADCVNPTLTHRVTYVGNSWQPRRSWKCPNHYELALQDVLPNLLHKPRYPRNPKYVNLEVIPREETMQDVPEGEGVVYRVPEDAFIQDFVARVKLDRAREQELAAWRAQQIHDLTTHDNDAEMENASGMSNLNADEREAVQGLLSMMNETPAPAPPQRRLTPALVFNQLLDDAPPSLYTTTNELDMLRTIQDLVNQRVEALASDHN
ncbi:hypothetical protein VTO42DRAFT_3085 [Malbranchea cinnamomea]